MKSVNKTKARLKCHDVHSAATLAAFAAAGPECRRVRLSMAAYNADAVVSVLRILIDRFGAGDQRRKRAPVVTLELYRRREHEEYGGFKYNLSLWKTLFDARIVERLVFEATPLTFRMIYNSLPITHSISALAVRDVPLAHVPGAAMRSYFENRVLCMLRSLALVGCGLRDADLLLILKTTQYVKTWHNEALETVVAHRARLETLNVDNNLLTGISLGALLEYALLRVRESATTYFTVSACGNAVLETNVDSAAAVALADMLRTYPTQLSIDVDGAPKADSPEEEAEIAEDAELDAERDIEMRATYDGMELDDVLERRGRHGKDARRDALLEMQLEQQAVAADVAAGGDSEESSESAPEPEPERDEAPPSPPAKRLRVSESEVNQLQKDIRKHLTVAPLPESVGSRIKLYLEDPDTFWASKAPLSFSSETPPATPPLSSSSSLGELPPSAPADEIPLSASAGETPRASPLVRLGVNDYQNAPFLKALIKAKKAAATEECPTCHQRLPKSEMASHTEMHAPRRAAFLSVRSAPSVYRKK